MWGPAHHPSPGRTAKRGGPPGRGSSRGTAAWVPLAGSVFRPGGWGLQSAGVEEAGRARRAWGGPGVYSGQTGGQVLTQGGFRKASPKQILDLVQLSLHVNLSFKKRSAVFVHLLGRFGDFSPSVSFLFAESSPL